MRAATSPIATRHTTHIRHLHKHISADLPHGCWCYFRGPHEGRAATAANLTEFVRELPKLDERVLSYHLNRGDFSRWVSGALQDATLGRVLSSIEHDAPTAQSIAALRASTMLTDAITARYHCEPSSTSEEPDR